MGRLLPPCSEELINNETSKETKDEDNLSLLKEQAIDLPAKMFPVSVFEALIRKMLQLTLIDPESYHIPAVSSVKKVRSFNFNLEKHGENKQILPKSVSGNKYLDKVFDDVKYHQKIFRGRSREEETQNEKTQPQQVTCVPEESSEVLNKTELIRLGKQGKEAENRLGSPQVVQNLSVDFKDLKKHFEESPKLVEKQGNVSEIWFSGVKRVCNGEDIIKMEEKREQPQKTAHQTNISTHTGLKEKEEEALKLWEPNQKNFSWQKIAAENMQYAYSQKFFGSEEERCLLNILSPMQERTVCLSKLPWSNFFECFCHLSPLDVGNECIVKIHALEKAVALCSQRIFLLIQENETYFKKVCILQQENERYAQMMRAWEEEMDVYCKSILPVDEANIVSFQNLLNEKDVAGECYINLSEENTVSPETLFAETFSKSLSCVEEENRNSEKDLLTIASNKLPRSFLSPDGKKMRYFQLLSDLKEERSRCFKEIAKLLQNKENYVAKCNELIHERKENLQKISLLEGEKEALLECVAEVKREQVKYRTLVSELQECKNSCYQTISDLQEEKCILKREIDKIKKETSEQLDEVQKANANFILENNTLKEFMSLLGFTYEELRKESLETKEKIIKLREESQHGLKRKKAETACSVTQTEEEGSLVIDSSNYFPRKEVNNNNEECYQAGSPKERGDKNVEDQAK